MLRYEHIAHKEKDLLAMTGYTQQEFMALVPPFQQSYTDYLRSNTIEGYERIGQVPKPYHNSPLPTPEDKLLFILVYLKQNPTQTLHGYLFGMSQSNAHKWIQLLHTVLNQTLAAIGALPQRDMVITTTNAPNKGADALEAPPFSSTMVRNDR